MQGELSAAGQGLHRLGALRLISSRSSGKVKCERDWNWRVAALRDYDVWFVTQGTGQIDINGVTHPAEAGYCFLLRPGDQVTASHEPEDRLTVLYAHFKVMREPSGLPVLVPTEAGGDPLAAWPRLVRVRDTHWLETLLGRLFSLDDEMRDDCDVAEFDAVLRAALTVLARDSSADDSREQRTPAAVRQVIRAIREHASSPLTHEELARIAGLSERYLNVLFKRHTGMPLKTFAAKARVERACRLLEESALSIGQIAEALGYSDIYFFSKQFKQFIGIPPMQYRNRSVNGYTAESPRKK